VNVANKLLVKLYYTIWNGQSSILITHLT